MKKLLAFASLWLSAAALAAPADPKTLAQFDVGYTRCEKLFPHMRGQRDEAYLSLWKIRATPKARSELASLRKGSRYRQARELALKDIQKNAGAQTDKKVKTQCEATWAQRQRTLAPPKAASGSPR